ncbi:thiamine phosphate synthase [Gordonia sp. CPCC 205515]|uniref:thiamine phosphate synthase n=1 Tax=Gordonia sp. CPCC 205515 TaxID=3140791 RepID=UPI003AF3CF00
MTDSAPTASTRTARLDRLAAARLYLCTDARRDRGDLLEFVAAALAGGVDIVQLRDKGSAGESAFGVLEAGEELAILRDLRDLTRSAGALLSVNDRADIATLAQADVLHVGQGDLPPTLARAIVGPDVLIGLSTHDEAQVQAAAANESVDYFCVGPCWPTPTKPGRHAPGLDLVRAATALDTATPWFAIGGVDADRLPEVTEAGADRVVVVRAITGADDPRAAAADLKSGLSAPHAWG